MVPIQIKAQVLRRSPSAAFAGAGEPFAIVPEDGAGHSSGAEAPRKAIWRQSDVRRAIAAAEQAGLQSYRIEITPEGTLAIIVGAPSDTTDPSGNLWGS